MNMMTNLRVASLCSLPEGIAPWVPIAALVVLVLLAVFIFNKIRSVKEDEQNTADQSSMTVSANGKPGGSAVAPEDDDAMMAAVVGAIAANEEQGAILAAITAAISVVWESEHPGTGFRVVSYRHVEKRSPWNAR